MNGHEFKLLYECDNESILAVVDAMEGNRYLLFPAVFRYIAEHELVEWNVKLAIHTDQETGSIQVQTEPFYTPNVCLRHLLMEMLNPEYNLSLSYPKGVK